eukprot:6203985-Pleurochrysis_carterae.AAC.2
MIFTYPAHLATKAQGELQRPSYKIGSIPFVSTDHQGLRRAVASRFLQQHDPPPKSTATLSWRPPR